MKSRKEWMCEGKVVKLYVSKKKKLSNIFDGIEAK